MTTGDLLAIGAFAVCIFLLAAGLAAMGGYDCVKHSENITVVLVGKTPILRKACEEWEARR